MNTTTVITITTLSMYLLIAYMLTLIKQTKKQKTK